MYQCTIINAGKYLSVFFLLTSCLDGPQLFKQDGSADSAFISLKLSQVEEGIYDVNVDANQLTTQSITLPDGTALNFPPNSLVLSSTITVQYGSSLLSAELAESSGAGSLSEASMPVVVSASTSQDTSNPFTMELPITQTSLRLADTDEFEKLVVIFKKTKVDNGEIAEGIIPRVDISVKDRKAKFSTRFFGSYQLAYTQNKISQAIERQTTVPILTQKVAKALPAVGWSVSYFKFAVGGTSGTVSFSQNGMKDPISCVAQLDRNEVAPFDITKTINGKGLINFLISEFNSFPTSDVFKIRLDCTDSQGRNEKSNWFTLFDSSNDPRASSSHTFKLISYSQGTLASPHNNNLPVNLTFDSQPNLSTLNSGIQIQNLRNGETIPFNASASNNNNTANIVPSFSKWPLFSPLNFNLNASVIKDISTKSLSANSNFTLHTADGSWSPTTSLNHGANSAVRVMLDTNDQGKAAYIRAHSSNGVGFNYFDGTNWGTETWISALPGAAGVWVEPSGVAFVAFRDNTSSTIKAYRYNISTLNWDLILNQGTTNNTTLFPFGLIAYHESSNVAYLIQAYTSGSYEIKVCRLTASQTNCNTSSFQVYQMNASNIIGRVNRDGDFVIGTTESTAISVKFLTAESTTFSIPYAASPLSSAQDFDVNIMDRKPGDAFPVALGVYGQALNPVYFTSSNYGWNSGLNFLNNHTGSTVNNTSRPSVSVSAGGSAVLAIRESVTNDLFIRMIKDYGNQSVFYQHSPLPFDSSERTQTIVNSDGLSLIAFKANTVTLTHVLCKLNSGAITCASQDESDVNFVNSNPNKFMLLKDSTGNFMSLYQHELVSRNLKMKRFRYDNFLGVPGGDLLDLHISGAVVAIGASVDSLGRVKATIINGADMLFSDFK